MELQVMEYHIQKEANISAYLWEKEYAVWRKTLEKVVHAFEEEKVKWAISCSANLFFRGIVDDFHDLDLLIEESYIPIVKSIMKKLGADLLESEDIEECKSNVFMEYKLDGIDFDIISGFRVITFGTQYLYELNPRDIEFIKVENVNLPLVPMEAQFLLYAMMEGWQRQRRYKRLLCTHYIMENGVEHPQILVDAIYGQLPGWIKEEAKKIMAT